MDPVNCSICHDRFRDPKVLPCLHCFCRDCIDLLRIPGRDAFHCPECRTDVTIPDNDADKLPDAFPIYHQIELSRFKDKLASGEVSTCDLCARGENHHNVIAEGFCTSCKEHICRECLDRHGSATELSDHKVVPYKVLVESADFSQHTEILKCSRSAYSQHFMRCSKHSSEHVNLYCFDCNELICSVCADVDHKKHTFDLIEKSAQKRKSELCSQLPSVRVLHKRLAGSVADVKRARVSIDNQKQSLSLFIDNEFERMYKMLERQKADLHKKLNQMAEGKLDKLAAQQLKLESASFELGRVEHFTEDSLEAATETELLSLYRFLQDRISDATRRWSQVSVQPVEIPNLAVKTTCGSHVSELCHKRTLVYCSEADASKCTAEGPGLKTAETLKTTYFTVHVFNKNKKHCKGPQYISVEVKCLSTDTTFSAEVHDSGKGFYTATFCPTLRGQHEIQVLVNDHHVRGSPFLIHVHHPPSQLGKSQGVIEGLRAPRGIAINPEGNLLVTEWNDGRIVEYDRQGKFLQSFGSAEDTKSMRRLCHPAGIATDQSGSIYVVDAAGEECCLLKYTSEGLLVTAVGREGTNVQEFKNPRGLAFRPQTGELYVCDRDNHRLQIFNTNLECTNWLDIGQVDKHLLHSSKPNDVAFDQAGNMYVADYSNSCILCFDSNHQYLHTMSRPGNSAGCLSGPESVHIDEHGLLYVTESKNHCVSVFRSSQGKFVTKFGRLGSGDNELKFPMGLVTDENGFVYVCELFNHRVQVF